MMKNLKKLLMTLCIAWVLCAVGSISFLSAVDEETESVDETLDMDADSGSLDSETSDDVSDDSGLTPEELAVAEEDENYVVVGDYSAGSDDSDATE